MAIKEALRIKMKLYGHMKTYHRYNESSAIDKGYEDTLTAIKQSQLIELVNEDEIYFKSVHQDGTIIMVPFICELSEYHAYPLDIAAAVCANAQTAVSRNYKDVLTGKMFICHDELITPLDKIIFSNGRSNFGEYLYPYKYYHSNEVIEKIKGLTKEDILAYMNGIKELQRIIRENYSEAYATVKKNNKAENAATRKKERYIRNFGKNLLR